MELLDRNPFLRELLASRLSHAPSGERVPLGGDVQVEYAEALYQYVRRHRPRRVVEVGLAHGISALAILTALEANGGEGELVSIDPFQSLIYKDCGLTNLALSGLSSRHSLARDPDWVALPRLLDRGFHADFSYVDGSHAFEHVMLDTFYCDKLLKVGGVIAYNDCGYEAVEASIRYLLASRHYDEVDAGLPFMRGRSLGLRSLLVRGWRDPRAIAGFWRRLQQHKLSALWRPHQDRYFRKRDDWVLTTDIPLPF